MGMGGSENVKKTFPHISSEYYCRCRVAGRLVSSSTWLWGGKDEVVDLSSLRSTDEHHCRIRTCSLRTRALPHPATPYLPDRLVQRIWLSVRRTRQVFPLVAVVKRTRCVE